MILSLQAAEKPVAYSVFQPLGKPAGRSLKGQSAAPARGISTAG